MDATAFSAALERRRSAPLSTVIHDSAAAFLTALLSFAAVFLLIRRWAGGLSEPLPVLVLIGVGITAVVVAEAIRSINQRTQSPGEVPNSMAPFWLPFAALPILAYAVSLPGSSFFGLTILWLTIVGEEVRAWQKWKTARPEIKSFSSTVGAASRLVVTPHPSAEPSPPADWHNAAISQQIVYRPTADNNAVVEGWVRAAFAVGQQTAIVHVAFCPPFVSVPQVEAESLDGPACEIRPTLVLPWGVRWECKLDDPATTNTSVVLEFFAAESPAESTVDQR